ncbi:MAG: HAD family hydrolase [bacterium]
MNEIKAILFDKDGTLLDFNRTWLEPYWRAARYLQARFGARADADALLARGGFIAKSQSWKPDSTLASGSNDEIIALWESIIGEPLRHHRRAIDDILTLPRNAYAPAVDDLGRLLASLRRRGLKLGLATMDRERSAHDMLRALRADAFFDFVCGDDSGHGVKPQPGMALAFCRACGVRAQQMMMVGDSPRDMQMGRSAGAALNVGVLTGAHGAADLAPCADAVLASIAELDALLDDRGGRGS